MKKKKNTEHRYYSVLYSSLFLKVQSAYHKMTFLFFKSFTLKTPLIDIIWVDLRCTSSGLQDDFNFYGFITNYTLYLPFVLRWLLILLQKRNVLLLVRVGVCVCLFVCRECDYRLSSSEEYGTKMFMNIILMCLPGGNRFLHSDEPRYKTNNQLKPACGD